MLEQHGMKWTSYAVGVLAVVVLAADLLLSATFGLSINYVSTLIYGAISLGSGLLLILASAFYFSGWKPLAYALAAAWVPCFGFNILSNMGVATGGRMAEVQKASYVKANFNEKRKAKKEAEVKLKTFTDRRVALIKKRGWSAYVPANIIQAKIDAYPGIQANIWRRTKQCSDATIPASIDYCKGFAALQEDLRTSLAIAKLNGQIEATERVLANARNEIETADTGISNTTNQSTLHAKLFSWTANPDVADVERANEGLGVFSAFVLALLAAALGLAQAWPKLSMIRPMTSWTQPPRPPQQKSWLDASALPNDRVAQKPSGEGVTLRETTVGQRNRDKIREALASGRIRLESPLAA